jgi:hypothetical protein
MSKTDTTEKGFETLIMRHMTGTDGLASGTAAGVVAEAAPADPNEPLEGIGTEEIEA